MSIVKHQYWILISIVLSVTFLTNSTLVSDSLYFNSLAEQLSYEQIQDLLISGEKCKMNCDMKKLEVIQMATIEGGVGESRLFSGSDRLSWKCLLGLGLILGGLVASLTGVGLAAADGAVGGGATLVNSNC